MNATQLLQIFNNIANSHGNLKIECNIGGEQYSLGIVSSNEWDDIILPEELSNVQPITNGIYLYPISEPEYQETVHLIKQMLWLSHVLSIGAGNCPIYTGLTGNETPKISVVDNIVVITPAITNSPL